MYYIKVLRELAQDGSLCLIVNANVSYRLMPTDIITRKQITMQGATNDR